MHEPKTATEIMMRRQLAVTRAHAAAQREGYRGPEISAFAHGATWAYEELMKHCHLLPKDLK